MDAGIKFTPVTGLSRTSDASAALKHSDRGLAIRLTRAEFEAGNLSSLLRHFMTRHTVEYEATDLIVDLGPVGDMVTDGVTRFATQFLGDVPNPGSWRTLTLSASAFPLSMGVVGRNSHAVVARAEWLAWRNHLRDGGRVRRVPAYSDCAIQHPSGVEGFDPKLMQVSATVRYTLSESWLLIKGESTRRNPARLQFPRLAKQLVYGHLSRQPQTGSRASGQPRRGDASEPSITSPKSRRRCGLCPSPKLSADRCPDFGHVENLAHTVPHRRSRFAPHTCRCVALFEQVQGLVAPQ